MRLLSKSTQSGLLLMPVILAGVFACAQTPTPAITLDPPTGWEAQAQNFDSKGEALGPAPANFRRFGEATVGQPSSLHTLTLRFAEPTKLTEVAVTSDFQIEQGGSCVKGNAYQRGATCTLLVRFTPQGPGNRLGRLSISTSGSATPMAFGIGGLGYSPVISFIPSIITTVPGTYPSSVGLLSGAWNLTVDGADRLYIADTGNGLIRSMDSSGTFKTMASGFAAVQSVAVDTYGQVYFNVPQVNGGPKSGTIYQAYDYSPVISGFIFNLGLPWNLSMDPNNRLFMEEQYKGAAFLAVQPYPSTFTDLYDGFSYQTNPPGAFAVDSSDNLYTLFVAGGDCQIMQQSLYNATNSIVQFNRIVGGQTCGFSGDGGAAGNAEMGAQVGQITFDVAGNLYFSDFYSQRVRRVDYNTGIIRTIAGNGVAGYAGDGGPATSAALNAPTGVAVDSKGQVYIISNSAAAGSAQVVRKVTAQGVLSFGNQIRNTPSTARIATVSNTGNSTMVLSHFDVTGPNAADFVVDPITTSCNLAAGGTLDASATCTIGVIFTPTATGARSATIVFADNTVTNSNTILLSGTGVLPVATLKITAPTAGQSFNSGAAVPLTASVTSTTGAAPTGTVAFAVDGAPYGIPITISSGVATNSVIGLANATHTLSATYSGDANYPGAGPVSVSIVVGSLPARAPTSVSLVPVMNSGGNAAPSSFAINVAAASGTVPGGLVQLLDGKKVLSAGSLVNGHLTLMAPPLATGMHALSAVYSGDALHLGATSPIVLEVVTPGGSCSDPGRGRSQ